ncbi:hypothetical protein [Haloechinothrix salitolerans]|uniref:Uncharacterized protein n=1 Tax=Haloechinothrix salitolerans TaxID=926830 RepID=A0ABW2BUN9_9PSEU
MSAGGSSQRARSIRRKIFRLLPQLLVIAFLTGILNAAYLVLTGNVDASDIETIRPLTPIAAILSAFLSLAITFVALRQSRIPTREPSDEERSTLTGRVDDLREYLRQSSLIIEELNAELHVQTSALERMRAEAEQNQRLAALHQDEADAVRKLVDTTIKDAHEEAAAIGRRIQWKFFLGGLLASIPIGFIANVIYGLLSQ